MLSELDNVVLIYLTLNVDSTILSKKIVNSTMNLINEICYKCEKKKASCHRVYRIHNTTVHPWSDVHSTNTSACEM